MKKLFISLLLLSCITLNTFSHVTQFSSAVNISKLCKVKLLQMLYHHARPFGLGILHYKPGHQLSDKDAKNFIHNGGLIDYLHGRPIKVHLSKHSDILYTEDYNKYNGENLAESIIEELRKQ